MHSALLYLFLGITALTLSSCTTPQSIHPDTLVVVKDVRIPDSEPWVARFARHTWIDYRPDKNSPWKRIEIVNKNSGLLHHPISDKTAYGEERWDRQVRILSQSDGKKNPDFVRDIASFAKSYDPSVYRAWPGPNSNTFTERLMRNVDGVSAQLNHNAVGKKYGFHVGRTAAGTGGEVQASLIGVSLGLQEGVEVSLLGLSGGVALYPPAIKIPILPRIPGK